jgi:hypothetical protein
MVVVWFTSRTKKAPIEPPLSRDRITLVADARAWTIAFPASTDRKRPNNTYSNFFLKKSTL